MAVKRLEGKLDATGHKYALVVSRFNSFLTDKLVDGAVDCLVRHGATEKDQTVAHVPGAIEIPAVAARLVATKKYDGIICLGAVVRGATPHFDYVAAEAAKGVAKLSMDSKTPVIFGVITTDTLEQAVERAGTKSGNKGWDAAQAAIEMVNLYQGIK